MAAGPSQASGARAAAELPAVGDWVVVRKRPDEDRGAIVAVLPRRSRFSRKMAGQVTDEQVVAANVDVVFIVMALDADFSAAAPRALSAAGARERRRRRSSLLTKPDLGGRRAGAGGRRRRRSPASCPCTSSARSSTRASSRWPRISPPGGPARCSGRRASARARSSTVSSATTCRRRARCARADSKGRHTTTHRELVVLPSGGLIIDTPGMRELQLWDVGEAVRETFDDVEALARGCHFTRLPASRRAALRREGGRRRRPARGGSARELPEAPGRARRLSRGSRTSGQSSSASAGQDRDEGGERAAQGQARLMFVLRRGRHFSGPVCRPT